jgi:hypothetical protein
MRTLALIGLYNSNLDYLRSRNRKEACEKCKVRGNNMKKAMYGCIQKTGSWTIAQGVAHGLVGAIDLRRLPPSSAVPSELWLSTLRSKGPNPTVTPER